MPLDVLPGELIAPTRSEWRTKYLRSFQLRNPLASVAEDTQPWVDASSLADVLVIQSENAKRSARGVLLAEATGARLDQRGAERGIARAQATSSSGFTRISASTTGTDLFLNDEFLQESTGLVYLCTSERHYANGEDVPVTAKDKGPQTNLAPGAILLSPFRPGVFPSSTVVAQADGTGLSGGREVEDDDTYRSRIAADQANPAASGNEAEYAKRTQDAASHGVPVQKAFPYPALFGPGSICIAFTLQPAQSGASRRPNDAQIAAVENFVVGLEPGDDSPAYIKILAQPKVLSLKVRWAKAAKGWTDIVRWPPFIPVGSSPGFIHVLSATDATHFVLGTVVGGYSGIPLPQVGQTFGIFDLAAKRFRRKKILSTTGMGPWTIVCDATNNASDTSYKPTFGDRPCPWSESLDSVVAPMLAEFDGLGPGELVPTFYDEGRRQRRNPDPLESWPNEISDRALDGLFALSEVGNARFADDPTGAPVVGIPGISVNIFELQHLAVFPL